jgi:8-oxo-dGTP pyrophosphatase MutT (NUDIX family)
MLKDYSYGIIPLMQKDNTRYTILIHLSSGNHRWIPKWHGEEWETALESAVREVAEETGLQIDASQVDTHHTYTEQYISWSKRHNQQVDKTVLYYTAILPYTDVTQLSGYSEWDGEILGKKIISLDEAIVLATYDDTRNILQEVKNNI